MCVVSEHCCYSLSTQLHALYLPSVFLQALAAQHIVVISPDAEEDVGSLVRGMADFAPPGSRVTLVSPETPNDLPDNLGNCQFEHLEGSIASRQTLLKVSQLVL